MILNSKYYFLIVLLFSEVFASGWTDLGSEQPSEPVWQIDFNDSDNIKIAFEMNGYFKTLDNNGKTRVSFPGSTPILQEGAPNLPRTVRSIIIPDQANMELSITDFEYLDIQINNVEPSKGNLIRNIDPSTVPYKYGIQYETDAFYPEEIAFLKDPYILRTLRGQSIVLQPIQYNPIKKILRVYTTINVSIKASGIGGINQLIRKPLNSESREFENIFKDHFINYPTNDRYDVLYEQGAMLVISHSDFLDDMHPFITWKNYKGIPTEIIDIADIGGVDEVSQYIEDEYYENGIAYVLLVGDIDQIESIRRSEGDGSNTPSDNSFTFVAGDDFYPDLIIGRFSAENSQHVETMINRTIAYEMEPDATGDWYKKGSGFASNEGPGDDGEYDYEHLDNIRELLLNYTYNEIDQVYDPTGTVAQGEAALNEGRSIVNYTGHGSTGSWGNGCPMNNTDVESLLNAGKWPFIWSVACVNGQFHQGTCFAETWLRATDPQGSPTGAVATLMSTVNQAWNPPMDGQDEMNAIFIESYSNNIKRTFGGLSFNGMNHMNDNYGSDGYNETLYWMIFGDPSVVLRSDTPVEISVSHSDVMIIGATSFIIDAGFEGALVSLSRDGVLLSSGYTDFSGVVELIFDSAIEIPGEIDIVVTGFNKIPYQETINVIAPEGAYIILSDLLVTGGDDNILDYGENGYFNATFENVGQDPSSELTFSLSHDQSMVNITSQEIVQESIDVGEQIIVGPFEFEVGWNLENDSSIPFVFSISDGTNEWIYEASAVVESPSYNINSYELFDDGNGTLEAGETAIMQIVMENTGNSPVHYPTFQITTNDSYITLDNIESDNAYYWDIGAEVTLTINVEASPDAPIGHSSVASIIVGSLHTDYEHAISVSVAHGIVIEDFESEDFLSFEWLQGGASDWYISTDSYTGDYSARSGVIGDNQVSELAIDVNVIYESDLKFWSKSSSEQGASGSVYDYLDFYVDEEPQGLNIGGETNWNQFIVTIPEGRHTLRWVYQKDVAQSFGDDCVWLDRIEFPAGSVFPLNIDFGDLNLDNMTNILDVIITLNYMFGNMNLSNEQIQNADMNLDGNIDVFDLIMIVDQVLLD
tara:strand:- start:3105 stop:6398 length:3294 start_codon:yes stop_codon:yes gene_type:complete